MFINRNTGDGSAYGYILYSEFVWSFRRRHCADLAGFFAPAGSLRLVDPSGAAIAEAHGRTGVESLVRSIHENVQFLDFTTYRLCWIAGRIEYDWSAVARNWGTGPAMEIGGGVHLELIGGSIQRADLTLARRTYDMLMSPGRC